MTEPHTSTCTPWAGLADVSGPCADYDFDPALLEDMLQVASDVLYNFTGRQWPGECSETVRPCGIGSVSEWAVRASGGGLNTAYRNGNRYLHGWCGCNDRRACACGGISEIKMPGYPVIDVTSVKIDGDTLDPMNYRVDDHRWLVRTDGEPFPCCQDLSVGDDEDGAFAVTYGFGTAPPIGGVMAAASLACELSLAAAPLADTECRLPARVTSITRQGVTMAVLDPLTLFDDGKTGLPEVDLWVASVRVGTQRRRATVLLPGKGRRVRRFTG